MKIFVTKKHIENKNARRKSADSCPVWCALSEIIPHCKIATDSVWIENRRAFDLPFIAKYFVKCWDNNLPVEPIEFSIPDFF